MFIACGLRPGSARGVHRPALPDLPICIRSSPRTPVSCTCCLCRCAHSIPRRNRDGAHPGQAVSGRACHARMVGNALNHALGAARGAKKVVEFSMSQMPRKLALLYSVSPDVHNGVRGAKSVGLLWKRPPTWDPTECVVPRNAQFCANDRACVSVWAAGAPAASMLPTSQRLLAHHPVVLQ